MAGGKSFKFPLPSTSYLYLFELTDNSSVTVQWAMSESMRQPNLMAKAQDEVRQICEGKKTIEEADVVGPLI